ncbi:MAG: hypothetical protein ACK5KR_00735 [Breznakia sp.]
MEKSVDVVTKFAYLEHGKKAQKNSSYKGKINTKSIIGWRRYGEREESRKLHEDAVKINEEKQRNHDQHGFFNYTSERIGSTHTYSSIGWITSKEKIFEFKNLIAENFNKDGDLLWVPVISLKDYMTATEMKMYNQNDYAAVIEKILPKFFKAVGFNNENMGWWMDYHVNTDNPHLHLSFFEKKKTIHLGKLPMKHIENFKKMFWNEVFGQNRFFEKTGEKAVDAFKNKDALKESVFKEFQQKIQVSTDEDLIKKWKELAVRLPINGRLQYGSSHMIPYRNDLDNLIDLFLHLPDVKEKYQAFLNSLKAFDEVRDESLKLKNTGGIVKSEDTKLRKKMANFILKEMKQINDKFQKTLTNDVEKLESLKEVNNDFKVIPVAKSLVKSQNELFTTIRIPKTESFIKIPTDRFIENFGGGKLYIVKIKQFDQFKLPLSKLEFYDKTTKNLKAITYQNISDYFSDGRVYIKNKKSIIEETIEFTKEENTGHRKLLRDHGKNDEFNINEDTQVIPIAKSLIKPYDEKYAFVEMYRRRKERFKRKSDWIKKKNFSKSTKRAKRASFAWMNEIEAQVRHGQTEYLYGKELNS